MIGPGPGPALSFAAIGHLEDRPALIDRAAEELAFYFEVDPKDVRRALSDPIQGKKGFGATSHPRARR